MERLRLMPTCIFTALLLLFLSANVNAQIGNRIKERIKQNTERKIEEKVVNKAGEKTDQALDSLFKTRKRPGHSSTKKSSPKDGGSEGNNSNNGSSERKSSIPQSSGFNFGEMMNATYESSYTLNLHMEIEVKSQEKPKKKVETATMDMYYGEDCYMMEFKDEKNKSAQSSKALMDLKNNTSIVLNDEDMSGIAISMKLMSDQINKSIENYQDTASLNDEYTFKKTGKTKVIAGYNCEEYLIETEDVVMNVWYTDEITVDMYQNLSEYPMFASITTMANYGEQGQLQGTMMESHMVEKTGDKGTFDYLVKEVNQSVTTLNMSDYQFMKM